MKFFQTDNKYWQEYKIETKAVKVATIKID